MRFETFVSIVQQIIQCKIINLHLLYDNQIFAQIISSFCPSDILWSFQDPASYLMDALINLHHWIFTFLIFIFILISWIVSNILYDFYFVGTKQYDEEAMNFRLLMFRIRHLSHGTLLEVVWTISPSIILLLIAIPSFTLLYAMEEWVSSDVIIKVIGHQWYWSYELFDIAFYLVIDVQNPSFDYEYSTLDGKLAFDSNMLLDDELKLGEARLLQVDKPLYLPVETYITALVTSQDVLHSFALPSVAVKIDAVPGRLNQTTLYFAREGTFYGQCSELCGVNHGFMPIVVKSCDFTNYFNFRQWNDTITETEW